MDQQPSKRDTYRDAVIVATGIVVIAWFIPGLAVLTTPINYLGTHTHELCHAVVALLTGAQAIRVDVFADSSGVMHALGGAPSLVSMAGYLGATAIGAALIVSSRTEKGAKASLRFLAGFVTLGSLLWLRGDLVGVLTGALWIGALWLMAAKLNKGPLLFAAQFLGLQLCVASIQSLMTLVNISALATRESDAENMAQMTGVPALVWAVTWCALGLMGIFVALRFAWAKKSA